MIMQHEEQRDLKARKLMLYKELMMRKRKKEELENKRREEEERIKRQNDTD